MRHAFGPIVALKFCRAHVEGYARLDRGSRCACLQGTVYRFWMIVMLVLMVMLAVFVAVMLVVMVIVVGMMLVGMMLATDFL